MVVEARKVSWSVMADWEGRFGKGLVVSLTMVTAYAEPNEE